MPKKENEVLNLTKVIASPVLSRKSDTYMWTGIIKSTNITPHLIEDDQAREKFIKLVKDLEYSTKIYRERFVKINNILEIRPIGGVNDEEERILKEHILEISAQIKEFLNKPNQNKMDMDLFWLEICRNYEELLEKNPLEIKEMDKEAQEQLERFRLTLNAKEPWIREIYLPEENEYVCRQFFTKGQEKKYIEPNKENSEKLLKVIENIAGKQNLSAEEGYAILKEIVTGVTLADFFYIFDNSTYASMQNLTILKNYLLNKGFTSDEIEQMSLDEIEEVTSKEYNSESIDFHSGLVADAVINGINYLNMDKLLLVAMIRPLDSLDLMATVQNEEKSSTENVTETEKKLPEQQEVNLDNFIAQELDFEQVLERTKRTEFMIKKILETDIVSKRTKFNLEFNDKNEEISLRRLQSLMTKFCDGIYMTDIIERNLIRSAYLSPDKMSTWSDELVQRIQFSEDMYKYALAMVNFENLKRLYNLGKIDKEDIKQLLMEAQAEIEEPSEEVFGQKKHISENFVNLLRNLYDSNMIDAEEIRQYFDEGIVSVKMLETLDENRTEEEIEHLKQTLGKHFNQEMLLEQYREYVEKEVELIQFRKEHSEEAEKIKELEDIVKQLRLDKEEYKKVFLKYNSTSTEAEKHVLGQELMEKFCVEMDIENEQVFQQSMITLYEDDLIDLENIIYVDKKYVIPMLDKLSLKDATTIRHSMSFEELTKMLDDIICNESFSDERKFTIVMNLLFEDSQKDKEVRETYLSFLKFDNISGKKLKTTSNSSKTNPVSISNGVKKSEKYVYPDFVKWRFYKSLDKDVKVTMHENGYVEFASPKLGARIIEKYYDGNKPAYGTATYILPEEEYRKNQDELITRTITGTILESSILREITPKKDRIVHRTKSTDRTWMDEIVKYFDIENAGKSRYTQEELEQLQHTVEKYKGTTERIF